MDTGGRHVAGGGSVSAFPAEAGVTLARGGAPSATSAGVLQAIREPALLAALAVAALLSRLPWFDTTLFISDSARYLLALERYDVTAGRPHPPGNPLYVFCVKGASVLWGDPVGGLALVSALAGTAAVLALYGLGREAGGRTVGAIAAVALASSPLFWFFGCVGMPATSEAALSVGLAWACLRARRTGGGAAFAAATVLMAAGFGLRSTFVMLVSPLCLWAAWPRRRALLPAGAAIAAAAIGWSLLAASLSGGWEAYSATNSRFLHEVVIQTKILAGGWAKAPHQLQEMGRTLGWGLGLFLLPFAGGLARVVIRGGKPGEDRDLAVFLALWTGPSLAFHAVYDWAPRFGVFFLPPAILLAAMMLARTGWGERPGQDARRWIAAGVAVAVAVSAAAFTLVDNEGSGVQLRKRNRAYAERDAWVGRFDPAGTLVLAHDSAFHAIWFLRDYEVAGLFGAFKQVPDTWTPHARGHRLDFEPGSELSIADTPWPLPGRIDRIVFYDQDLSQLAAAQIPSPVPVGSPAPDGAAGARWLHGPHGAAALEIEGGECLGWSPGRLSLDPCAGTDPRTGETAGQVSAGTTG